MTVDKMDYNKILYGIIKRNGGSRRWRLLRAVDIDTGWEPLAEINEWIYVARRYTISNGKNSYDRKSENEVPSQFSFSLDPLKFLPEHDVEARYLKFYPIENYYHPCVAFSAGETESEGSILIKVMCREFPIGSYSDCIRCKECDILEEELSKTVNSDIPGLYTITINDTPECEEKVCRLLDLIEDFVYAKRYKRFTGDLSL